MLFQLAKENSGVPSTVLEIGPNVQKRTDFCPKIDHRDFIPREALKARTTLRAKENASNLRIP